MCNPSEETAVPPDFSGWFTASITLHCWQPKRKDVSTSEALLHLILRLAVHLNRPWSSLPSSLNPFESSCFIMTSLEEAATSNDYQEDFYFTVDTFEFRCYYNVDHFRSGDYNDSNAGESDFNVVNFEDCHCTDGHQEDTHCLNHGQGVNKTPGA